MKKSHLIVLLIIGVCAVLFGYFRANADEFSDTLEMQGGARSSIQPVGPAAFGS